MRVTNTTNPVPSPSAPPAQPKPYPWDKIYVEVVDLLKQAYRGEASAVQMQTRLSELVERRGQGDDSEAWADDIKWIAWMTKSKSREFTEILKQSIPMEAGPALIPASRALQTRFESIQDAVDAWGNQFGEGKGLQPAQVQTRHIRYDEPWLISSQTLGIITNAFIEAAKASLRLLDVLGSRLDVKA